MPQQRGVRRREGVQLPQLLQWVMQQQSSLIRFPFHLAAHTPTHAQLWQFSNFICSQRLRFISFRFHSHFLPFHFPFNIRIGIAFTLQLRALN